MLNKIEGRTLHIVKKYSDHMYILLVYLIGKVHVISIDDI